MIFKTTASLNCVQCGYQKTFEAESDVYAINIKDLREIKVWGEDAELEVLTLKGICPDCKYNKAA